MKKIIDRIAEYIESKDISLNAFDRSLGLSNGYIGKQIKNRASIGGDIIEKISYAYSDLSIEWLITGKGLMIYKNEIRIPDIIPEPEGLVKNLLDMIDRKDQKIIEMAEEIGKLKNEVSILKKQGKSTNYLSVAEP